VKIFDSAAPGEVLRRDLRRKRFYEERWDGTGARQDPAGARIYWVRVDGQATAKPVMLSAEVK